MATRPEPKTEHYKGFRIVGPFSHSITWTYDVRFPDGEHFYPGFVSVKVAKVFIDKTLALAKGTDHGNQR